MQFLQGISIKNIWFVGLGIHLLAAWFSKGYFHADEHFQLLEYASYKLHHTDISNLPWEYQTGMRPSLQVMIVYLLSSALQFLNPFHIAFVLRLLSVSLSLLAVYHAGKTVFHNENHLKLYYITALFLWFMPYQMVRFSSENWSGIMILFSLILVLKNKPLLYSGLLCGLAFCFRYQSAFFIMGLFFWLLLIKKTSFKAISSFIAGFIIVFFIGILTDYWLYGKWVLSSFQYFYINLVEGKAAEFGTEPFYYYFIRITESAIVPFGLLLIISFFYYIIKQPKSIFTWVSFPFLILHCLIAHKEMRFLFPLIYFVPVFMVLLITRIQIKPAYLRPARIIVLVLISLNFMLLPFSSFKASNPRIALLEHLYREKNLPLCLNENPYKDVHWFSFYFPLHFNPENIKIISSFDSLTKGQMLIIPSYSLKTKDNHIQVSYRQVPIWIENMNYGHWLERSNFWCIAYRR